VLACGIQVETGNRRVIKNQFCLKQQARGLNRFCEGLLSSKQNDPALLASTCLHSLAARQ
jgi:hypothetical protein